MTLTWWQKESCPESEVKSFLAKALESNQFLLCYSVVAYESSFLQVNRHAFLESSEPILGLKSFYWLQNVYPTAIQFFSILKVGNETL